VRFSTRGVQKHHKKLLGKIHVKNFWPKKLRKKNLFPFIFSHGVFVRFSTRGVQKYYKKLFGESPCQKLLAEKVEKKNPFSCRLFPSIFFIAFLAVSLHEEPKNTINVFSKIRPENRKKFQKRYHGTYVAFFLLFLRRPLAPTSAEHCAAVLCAACMALVASGSTLHSSGLLASSSGCPELRADRVLLSLSLCAVLYGSYCRYIWI
jgi:hypothetical protein